MGDRVLVGGYGRVVVEVNVSGEATKHGCAPADVATLIDAVEASAPAVPNETAHPHPRRTR